MAKDLRNDDFLVIQAGAINELKLKGNDLIVFSVIYNYSKDGSNKYTGSLDYLAKWANSSPRSVMRNLDNLLANGFIEKQESVVNGIKFCSYNVSESTIDKMSIPMTICESTIDKMSNNNKVYNNKENTIINNSIKESKRFTKPTIEEINNYIAEKGYRVDAERFYNYYESKGWLVGKSPMKNWKSALTNWNKNNFSYNNNSYNSKKVDLPEWYESYKNREEDKYEYTLDTDGLSFFGGEAWIEEGKNND